MRRSVGLGLGLMLGVVVAACSGSTGPAGAAGAAGTKGAPGATGATGPSGTATPSVSAITPSSAFLNRTVDLTISGSGTAWDAKTIVRFASPGVTVNKVTVASLTGLLVNVTIGASATLGATDVSVTDGTTTSVYKAAFEILEPLAVTMTPTAGVPQGGLANLHITMADLTTPFDPNTTTVTLSSPDLAWSTPSPSDYAMDITVEADVLATTGKSDLSVSTGETTPVVDALPGSVTIVARAPTPLTTTTAATGTLNTDLDTLLYKFTPSAATQQFIQFTTSSVAGALSGTVIPKSGKFADAVAPGFAVRYAQGTTSTDPFYIVVGDSSGLFGPGPTPADSTLVAFESACTAMNEETETAASNNDSYKTAQPVATLPALVNGTLGYGSVDGTADIDVYSVTVASASQVIHAATGGDPNTNTVLAILDSTGTIVGSSAGDDMQADYSFTATASGTYYVAVSAGSSFSDTDNTYQLFISVK